jgi:PAS domain S-box-containing protein
MSNTGTLISKAEYPRLSDRGSSLRLILETALDAVIVMRSDGTVADWNERATETFGWTRHDVIGKNMANLIIPPRYREAHRDGLALFLTAGTGPVLQKRIEISAIRKSGEEFPVELSISPLVDDAVFLFVGCVRDITERKQAEEHQKLLLEELNHRAKNILSTVSGIASRTAKTSASVDEFSEKFSARLQSLGRAHTILTAASWQTTSLADLAKEILSPHRHYEGVQFEMDGPPLQLTPKEALAITMILHELATNAIKYGALSTSQGKISVGWTETNAGSGPTVHLHWHESGLTGVSPPRRAGFGSKLIEASTRHELGGDVAVDYRPDGVHYDFRFPAHR